MRHNFLPDDARCPNPSREILPGFAPNIFFESIRVPTPGHSTKFQTQLFVLRAFLGTDEALFRIERAQGSAELFALFVMSGFPTGRLAEIFNSNNRDSSVFSLTDSNGYSTFGGGGHGFMTDWRWGGQGQWSGVYC